MNQHMIQQVNDHVAPGDILYHLGDVIMGNVPDLFRIRKEIKVKTIHLILGNHDKAIKGKYKRLFTSVKDYNRIRYAGEKIYLFHCPMHTWPGINKGHIQLHGHCHGNLPDRNLRQMDIGVDTNDYKPYLLDDVIDLMLKRTYKNSPDIPKDHHNANHN